MRKRTPRILQFATIIGLICVVPGGFLLRSIMRQKRNVRLAEAVYLQKEPDVKALLAEGADPNALMQTPSYTPTEILDRAFHPDQHQGHHSTILMYAAAHCEDRILRCLLEGGGDIRDETLYGYTALTIAIDSLKHRNVALLVQYGSNVNGMGHGPNPLTQAILKSPDRTDFWFLLAHGADPNGQLLQAALMDDPVMIRTLLDAGVSLHTKDRWQPLAQAAAQGKYRAVAALLRAGADPNVLDWSGHTPLMDAAQDDRADAIRALLKAGAQIDARDSEGMTALGHAVSTGRNKTKVKKSVTALLDAGADRTLRDKQGRDAEGIAMRNGYPKAAQLIHTYRPPTAHHP
ncbi:MAG: hypothetical protein JWN14_3665 [Chthonomonadales bacterium]|nr:hypothetical protein [Chthonomonadales bacterium]